MGCSGIFVALGVAWLTVLIGRRVGDLLEMGPPFVADWANLNPGLARDCRIHRGSDFQLISLQFVSNFDTWLMNRHRSTQRLRRKAQQRDESVCEDTKRSRMR
jgi:hypothetical protein